MAQIRTTPAALVAVLLASGFPVGAQVNQAGQSGALVNLQAGPRVNLPCAAAPLGGTATNTTGVTIPTGTRIEFTYRSKSPTGPGGSAAQSATAETRLRSPLPPGQFVMVTFMLADGEQCSAWFYGGFPDLQVTEVALAQGQVGVRIRNNNHFTGAGASVARVGLMRCNHVELESFEVSVPAVPKGQTVTVARPVRLPTGFQYFDAVADSGHTVRESNEANNGLTGAGVCIH